MTRNEFVAFIKKAVEKGSPEHRELYFFLLRVYKNVDHNKDGFLSLVDFDRMIETAVVAPRRFGLAHVTSEMNVTHAVSAKNSSSALCASLGESVLLMFFFRLAWPPASNTLA